MERRAKAYAHLKDVHVNLQTANISDIAVLRPGQYILAWAKVQGREQITLGRGTYHVSNYYIELTLWRK